MPLDAPLEGLTVVITECEQESYSSNNRNLTHLSEIFELIICIFSETATSKFKDVYQGMIENY